MHRGYLDTATYCRVPFSAPSSLLTSHCVFFEPTDSFNQVTGEYNGIVGHQELSIDPITSYTEEDFLNAQSTILTAEEAQELHVFNRRGVHFQLQLKLVSYIVNQLQ